MDSYKELKTIVVVLMFCRTILEAPSRTGMQYIAQAGNLSATMKFVLFLYIWGQKSRPNNYISQVG